MNASERSESLISNLNLDCATLDPDELDKIALALVSLANYARHKANSMRHRAIGKIADAVRHEKNMQAIYETLPEWARW